MHIGKGPDCLHGQTRAQSCKETGHLLLACREVFASLDRLEQILSKQRYVAGDRITEVRPCIGTGSGNTALCAWILCRCAF